MPTPYTLNRPINILHVEDDKNWQSSVEGRLKRIVPKVSGQELKLTSTTDFVGHYERILAGEFDLLILDLRAEHESYEGEYAGKELWDKLSNTQFIPVIFLTGNETILKGEVQPPGFVEVVAKSFANWYEKLEEAFTRIWDQRLIQIRSAVQSCLTTRPPEIIRTFYKEFVERYNQAGQSVTEDTATVAKLLARHIVESLEQDLVGGVRLAVATEAEGEVDDSTEKVDAADVYNVPPSLSYLCTGMLLRDPESKELWVVVTPTCDLVEAGGRHAKCGQVLMLPVKSVSEWSVFKDWQEQLERVEELNQKHLAKEQAAKAKQPPNSELRSATERLKELEKTIWEFVELRSSNLRFYYLPALLKLIPQAYLDFQQTSVKEYAEVREWARVANLASPFAEHLQSKYAQYVGRIGVPEPRRDAMQRLMDQVKDALNK